jgi:DNA polymerase-4
MNKPNGLTVAPFKPNEIVAWLAPMPAIRIWGIGKKTNAVLAKMGISTVADLQKLSQELLVGRFGKQGEDLYALCRGIDDRPVSSAGEAKSISREHTFNQDSADREEWKAVLFSLSQDVARQARSATIKGATVVLIYRRSDFSRHTKRKQLAYPVNVAQFIYEGALELLGEVQEKALRLIGVGLTGFDHEAQLNLFAAEPRTRALEAAEATMDRIAARFGAESIGKARDLFRASGNNRRRSRQT